MQYFHEGVPQRTDVETVYTGTYCTAPVSTTLKRHEYRFKRGVIFRYSAKTSDYRTSNGGSMISE